MYTATPIPTQYSAPINSFTNPLYSGSSVCDCSANIYNCKGDFPLPNGATADECYAYCKSQGKGDVHGLDRDKDGDACEPGFGD